ncbi:MAG: methyl-accepting chemotaxis protein [Alphaproteobacteria bacterium]|nr:methyl-accepting chemotaxis protein [Alphaproteobacteria bacterium]
MTFQTFRRALYAALLSGGVVPLTGFLFVVPFRDHAAGFVIIAAVIFAGGWFLCLALASLLFKERQEDHPAAGESARQDKDNGFRSMARETAGQIMSKTRSLAMLTDVHQQRASETTSAAAKVTESATAIASAIEEMNGAIQEIGRQADEASHAVETAVGKGQGAGESVAALTGHMSRITAVVELIRSVAERTNLLALNATIEAVRAGEHGRGFAVVAQEVKSLASQTADATKQIESQISEVQAASKDAQEQMQAVKQAIQQINTVTLAVKGALQQQAAATREMASSAQTTTAATNGVTAGISHLLVTTEEIRRACEGLAGQAQSLDPLVNQTAGS